MEIIFKHFGFFYYGAPFLARGGIYNLRLEPGLTSSGFLGSVSRGTHNHCHNFSSPRNMSFETGQYMSTFSWPLYYLTVMASFTRQPLCFRRSPPFRYPLSKGARCASDPVQTLYRTAYSWPFRGTFSVPLSSRQKPVSTRTALFPLTLHGKLAFTEY
jgi:hypothetical protein